MRISDAGAQDIFDGSDTKRARKTLPRGLHEKAARLLDRLNAATSPDDLRTPKGNRLHKLTDDRIGQWSISIDDQHRICVSWENAEAVDVEITDYH
jgi:proteic killer suppression protein